MQYFCKRSKCPPMHLTPFDAPSPPLPSGCIAHPGGWGRESWSRWGAAGKSDPGSVDALARPRPSPLKPGRVGSDDSPAAVLSPTSHPSPLSPSVTSVPNFPAQAEMQRVIVIGSIVQLNPSESKKRDAGS